MLWSFSLNGKLRSRGGALLDSVVAAIGEAAAAGQLGPDFVTMIVRDAAALLLHKSHPL